MPYAVPNKSEDLCFCRSNFVKVNRPVLRIFEISGEGGSENMYTSMIEDIHNVQIKINFIRKLSRNALKLISPKH